MRAAAIDNVHPLRRHQPPATLVPLSLATNETDVAPTAAIPGNVEALQPSRLGHHLLRRQLLGPLAAWPARRNCTCCRSLSWPEWHILVASSRRMGVLVTTI